MTKKEIAEILKYASPKVLYVVTWNNILKKLYCPFKVKAKQDIGLIKKGEEVLVDEVKVNMELTTIFIIKQKAYYYYYFEIIVEV